MYRKVLAVTGLFLTMMTTTTTRDSLGADTLKNTVTAGLRYDSNIFSAARGAEHDFIFELSPGIDLLREAKTGAFDLSYRPTVSLYVRNPKLDYLSHLAKANMNLDLSMSTKLNIGDSFTYSKESLNINTIGIQTARTGIWSNTFTTGLRRELTQRATVALNVSDGVTHYDSPLSDTRTDSAGLEGNYKLAEDTTLTSKYTFTNYAFDFSGAKGHIDYHSVTVGADSRITPTLEINMSGGSVYTPSKNNRYDWTASAGVTKTFQKASLRASYSRAVTNSAGLVNQLSINDSYSASASYSVTSLSDLMLSGNYSMSRTKPSTVLDIDSYTVSGAWNWRPYTWLTVSTGVSHFLQHAKGSVGTDVKRESAFVNFTATPFERRFN